MKITEGQSESDRVVEATATLAAMAKLQTRSIAEAIGMLECAKLALFKMGTEKPTEHGESHSTHLSA
jgi:predicted DNA-binding protein with PD1-like motif